MLGSTKCFVPLLILFCDAVTSLHVFSSSQEGTWNIIAKPEMDRDTIVGGHNASIEDHPYQVVFEFKVGSQDAMCGGFIISENYILSAAHCCEGTDPATVKLRVGSTWRVNGTLVPIAEVIPHPEYGHLDKDVGLMKTASPIQFTRTVQPIKLPTKGRYPVDGSMLIVSGWGITKEDSPHLSDNLMAVDVPVVNFEKCKTAYKEVTEMTENMFCAGYFETGGKDHCEGDSGGPAVQDGIAVGIVSFANGCARPSYPGVYTNIAAPAVRDFITKHTGL